MWSFCIDRLAVCGGGRAREDSHLEELLEGLVEEHFGNMNKFDTFLCVIVLKKISAEQV